MYGGNVPPPNSPIQSNLRRVRLQEEVDAIAREKLRFSGVLGLLVMGMAVWAVHTSWSSTTTTRVPALAQEFDTSMTMALSSLRRLKKR